MLVGAREAGCFREMAALHSDHLRRVPLNNSLSACSFVSCSLPPSIFPFACSCSPPSSVFPCAVPACLPKSEHDEEQRTASSPSAYTRTSQTEDRVSTRSGEGRGRGRGRGGGGGGERGWRRGSRRERGKGWVGMQEKRYVI